MSVGYSSGRSYRPWGIVALWLALLVLIASPVRAEATFSARVVGVIDGDTLQVLTPEKRMVRVRLAEIDAPEHGQPWGGRSKQLLSDLVFGTVRAAAGHRHGSIWAHRGSGLQRRP